MRARFLCFPERALPELEGLTRTARSSPALSPSIRSNTPSSFRSPTSRTASPAQPPVAAALAAADPWDFDALTAATPAGRNSPLAPTSAQPPVDDLFDMGFDGSRFAPAAAATAPEPGPSPSSADDFDLLDAFAAPAVPARPKVSSGSGRGASPAVPTPRTHTPTARPTSPPPHMVGQLVDMGFSPDAATAALAATVSPASSLSSGGSDWNLEAALEVLAEQQKVDDARRRKQREADEWGDEDDIRIGRRRSWQFEDDDDAAAVDAERARRAAAAASARVRAAPDGESASPAAPSRRADDGLPVRPVRNGHSTATNDPTALARDQTDQLKEQATEVLAQAQKIGLSMFKSANAYWGEGKKALQKALEEQRAAAAAAAARTSGGGPTRSTGSAKGVPNGKPKWWREGMDDVGDTEGAVPPTPSSSKGKSRAEEPPEPSFKDSDDDEGGPESATRRPVQPSGGRREPPRAQPVAETPLAPTEYRSPFRRAKAAPAPAPREADLLSGAPAPVTPQPTAPRRSPAPSPVPRTAPHRPAASRRPPITVTASSVAAAAKHKSTAAEHFKLGRFGEATSAFTLALNALPEEWVGCVPLLNNRAQSRLKSGEEKAAAADCTTAIGILLAPTRGDVDLAALEAETGAASSAEMAQLYAGGASIDLRDQLGKSLARRAKAHEANEKWSLASEDWQKLLTLGDETVTRGAGGIKMISDGVARCRQMLDGSSASSGAARSTPRPTTAAAPKRAVPAARKPSTPVQGSGEAVRALQAQQAASAAEDDQRLQLKDQVDAQIASWKGGKETNLRALIASLDSVLWPSLGWKTVGMHELITDNQLKIRYVRAIAKVHPDKVRGHCKFLDRAYTDAARWRSSMRRTRRLSSG